MLASAVNILTISVTKETFLTTRRTFTRGTDSLYIYFEIKLFENLGPFAWPSFKLSLEFFPKASEFTIILKSMKELLNLIEF